MMDREMVLVVVVAVWFLQGPLFAKELAPRLKLPFSWIAQTPGLEYLASYRYRQPLPVPRELEQLFALERVDDRLEHEVVLHFPGLVSVPLTIPGAGRVIDEALLVSLNALSQDPEPLVKLNLLLHGTHFTAVDVRDWLELCAGYPPGYVWHTFLHKFNDPVVYERLTASYRHVLETLLADENFLAEFGDEVLLARSQEDHEQVLAEHRELLDRRVVSLGKGIVDSWRDRWRKLRADRQLAKLDRWQDQSFSDVARVIGYSDESFNLGLDVALRRSLIYGLYVELDSLTEGLQYLNQHLKPENLRRIFSQKKHLWELYYILQKSSGKDLTHYLRPN